MSPDLNYITNLARIIKTTSTLLINKQKDDCSSFLTSYYFIRLIIATCDGKTSEKLDKLYATGSKDSSMN